MASVAEEREIRRMNRMEAQRQDAPEGKLVLDLSRVNEKRQWYKADGTPLPVLLPCDDYNRGVFQARGWTLSPPRAGGGPPLRPAGGLSPIEQEIQRAKDKAAGKLLGAGPITVEVQREIAGVVRDKMSARPLTGMPPAPVEDGAMNFLAAEPVLRQEKAPLYVKESPAARPGPHDAPEGVTKSQGLCLCGWKSTARNGVARRMGLNRHIKGAESNG